MSSPPLCSNGVFSLGVADGVYMWATMGIDSGEFSRSLMRTAKGAVEAGTADVLNGEGKIWFLPASSSALPNVVVGCRVCHSREMARG